MADIKTLMAQASAIDTDLEMSIRELGIRKPNLEIDNKPLDNCKETLSQAQKSQQSNIRHYEDDNKRYKVLKRYGEVLQKIEKLMGLIPTDTKNLTTEELEEKLEELLKSKKKNQAQFSFIFYQNLITNLLSNLVTIEKDFQDGKLSTSEALNSVKSTKQEINYHSKDMPHVLTPAVEDALYLVKLYEESFSLEATATNPQDRTPLKSTALDLKHEVMFEKLNTDTQTMISKISDLSTDIADFEPQINLDKLAENLKSTEDLLKTENFDYERMDASISSIENITNALTDKQVELNKTNESLEERINSCTMEAHNLSKDTTFEFSRELFIDSSNRTETNIETAQDVETLLENEQNLSTTIGSQVANTIISQLDADETVCDIVASRENTDTSVNDPLKRDEARDVAEDLCENVLSLEEKRELLLKLELNPNDIPDEKKE